MPHFDINRVVLVGRLTRDPELRALASGANVCAVRLACNASRREPGSDEYVERPNFFDVSVFGASGERVSEFMRKGSRVAVDGRLEWREWEGPDQEHRQAVSVVADRVMFLDRGEHAPDDGQLAGVGAAADEDDAMFR
jgi:single-strand DNA-binding protein